jgi:hypothetical protein
MSHEEAFAAIGKTLTADLGASAKLLHQRLDTAVQEGRLDLQTLSHFEGFLEVLARQLLQLDTKIDTLIAQSQMIEGQLKELEGKSRG